MKTRHLFTFDVRPGHLYRLPAAPANVMLDVTWRCDQRCTFCYNPAEDRRRADPPAETLLAIVDRVAAWGVTEILYLGGEPTLHPSLERVLAAGARHGLTQRLVTNGGHVDDRFAALAADLHLEVGVSLHASVAEVHDRLTGVGGSFDRAIMALDRLAAVGVRTFVQHSPVRANAGQLLPMEALLYTRLRPAIGFIDVNRMLSQGEAAGQGCESLLDGDGWWAVVRAAGKMAAAGRVIRIESVPRCWIRRRASAEQLPEVTITALLGSLRPCYMAISQLALDPLGRPKLCPGGPTVGPSILVADPRELWLQSEPLHMRRSLQYLAPTCVNYDARTLCQEFYECGGGCHLTGPGLCPSPDVLTRLPSPSPSLIG